MLKCTVAGDRELPGLPEHEVQLLKNQILILFPGYWNSPVEFSHCGPSAPSLSGRDTKDFIGTLSDSVHSKLSA